jgi:hypothetical protein
MVQVHVTAYLKAHWRPLQAIAVGLILMGGAFLPLLAARPFLPIYLPQDTFSEATNLYAVVIGIINFSPAFVSAMRLSLGAMMVQPFGLSLIPTLSGNRLLGTYFGFYCLVQGSGTIAGNLAISAAFDAGEMLGFQSFPWLLVLGFGLASAISITALDRRGATAPSSDVSRLANMTAARG